jgi:hypothetical protein
VVDSPSFFSSFLTSTSGSIKPCIVWRTHRKIRHVGEERVVELKKEKLMKVASVVVTKKYDIISYYHFQTIVIDKMQVE